MSRFDEQYRSILDDVAASRFAGQIVKPKPSKNLLVTEGTPESFLNALLDQVAPPPSTILEFNKFLPQFQAEAMATTGAYDFLLGVPGADPDAVKRLTPSQARESARVRQTNPFGNFQEAPAPGADTVIGEAARSFTNELAQQYNLPNAPFVGGFLSEQAQLAELDAPPQGVAGFVGQTLGGLAGIFSPKNLQENVVSTLAAGPVVKQIAKPIVTKITNSFGARAGTILENALEEAGEEATFSALQQAGKEDFVEDPAGALSRTLAAAGIGGTVGGLIGGGLAVPKTARDISRFNKVKDLAIDEGFITQQESTVIGDRPDVLADIIDAKNQGLQVTLDQNKDGSPRVVTKKDTVSKFEKDLLGNSEPFIQAYREARAKGAPKIDELTTEAKWLLFPQAREKGYFKSPENLATTPKLQARLAQLQRQTMLQLSVLRNDAPGLTVSAKVRLAAELDSQYIEKVETLLNKDVNTSTSTRRKVVKVLEKLPEEQQATTTQAITAIIDDVARRFPYETQLGTMDRVLDELRTSSNPRAEPARELLVELRDKMQTQSTLLATNDRVRQSQIKLRSLIADLSGLEFARGRDKVAEVVKDLPDHVRANLLTEAINAVDTKTLKDIADRAAKAQETYLRDTELDRLQTLTSKIGKNPQRDKVIAALAQIAKPLRSAINASNVGGTATPNGAGNATQANVAPTGAGTGQALRPAVRFAGKVRTGGDTHYQVLQTILTEKHGKAQAVKLLVTDKSDLLKLNTPAARLALKLLELPDTANGFVGSDNKFLSRDKAAKLAGNTGAALSTDKLTDSSKPKDVIRTNPKTGYVSVDQKALAELFKSLSSAELKLHNDRIAALLRRGQIEQKLYTKALGFDTKEDFDNITKDLKALEKNSAIRQNLDTPLHWLKLLVDPVMIEADLEQIGSSTHNVFHKNLIRPYDNHLRNQARRDQEIDGLAKKVLGIKSEGPVGKYKLLSYFNTKLPGTDVTRGRVMTLYALLGDTGRATDLKKYGAKDRVTGKSYDLELVKKLSDADRRFVDLVKSHFEHASYVTKAYRNVQLLTGRLPGVVKGWFPSRRNPQKLELESDFDTFAEGLVSEIDPLKDRVSAASGPFLVSDFYTTFVNVSDKLSLFGEVGKELYRADALMRNPEFKELYADRKGNSSFDALRLYLLNIHSQVGHTSTAFDQLVNKLQSGFTVSRVALNVFSAMKQYLHIFTLLGDGNLDAKDLIKSLTDGTGLNAKTRKEMLRHSGLAYQRYVGGHYMRNYLVLAEDSKLPSKLSVLQHYSMVLQRTADRQVMQVTWAAARKTAAREGYTGQGLLRRTNELFGISAGRDQPTDNPLYATELEIQAKRQPLARPFIMFQREQNRVYNVMRRHIVAAAKQPTPRNLAKATRALLFGVVANSLGAFAINELRRAAFVRPSTDEEKILDITSNVTGMYYLASPVQDLAKNLIDLSRGRGPTGIGPIQQTTSDLIRALGSLARAGDSELVTSGPNRGKTRGEVELMSFIDKSVSGSSAVLGLPLWSLWTQGKGLYKWSDDSLRAMVYFEHEKQRLKQTTKEDDDNPRLDELESATKRINEIHRMSEKGFFTKKEASSAIYDVLKDVGF